VASGDSCTVKKVIRGLPIERCRVIRRLQQKQYLHQLPWKVPCHYRQRQRQRYLTEDVEGVEVSTSKDTKNTKAISASFIPQKMNPLYLSLSPLRNRRNRTQSILQKKRTSCGCVLKKNKD
jgi:hypothetical protein